VSFREFEGDWKFAERLPATNKLSYQLIVDYEYEYNSTIIDTSKLSTNKNI